MAHSSEECRIFLKKRFIYYLFRPHRVLVAACGIFVVARGLLSSCGVRVFSL